MASFAAEANPSFTERRSVNRMDVNCPAHLILPKAINIATIENLSEKGARLKTTNPPQPGVTVLLQWNGHEASCQVTWAVGNACGVAFDRLLPLGVLTETCGPLEQPSPAAAQDSTQPAQPRKFSV